MKAPAPAIAAVYAAALVQGLGMVSFAASSTILKEAKGLTDAQYGTIFLPLVVATMAASLAGGALSHRMRLKSILAAALVFNILSQAALSSVAWLQGSSALAALLAATSLFGIAFGLSSGPLNAFPTLMFPDRRDASLLALHTVIGAGLSLGPFVAGWFIARDAWPWLPRLLALFDAAVLVAVLANPLRFTLPADSHVLRPSGPTPLRSATLWACVAMAVLYALAEGTLANWSVLYLAEDRGIAPALAAYALAAFWAAFAAGRLVLAALLLRVSSVRLWLASPVLMTAAFFLVPHATTAATGLAAFAFAGFACAGFFPLTISLASAAFPGRAALVSSVLTAGLMAGVGAGTYIVGPLRALLPMETVYRLSALCPAAAFVLGSILAFRGLIKR